MSGVVPGTHESASFTMRGISGASCNRPKRPPPEMRTPVHGPVLPFTFYVRTGQDPLGARRFARPRPPTPSLALNPIVRFNKARSA
jgi:hypothetical protein